MIRQITLGKYVDDVDFSVVREINRVISGEILLPFCPVPNGATIYFNDESNRAIPLISHIPIIRNFKEFTVNIPAIKTYHLAATHIFNGWNLDFLIMNEKDCFEIPHRIYKLREFGAEVHGDWFVMPSNIKKVRIYPQGYYVGATNKVTMGVYSYDESYTLTTQRDLLAVISTQKDGAIYTPPMELPCVNTLAFSTIGASGGNCSIRLAVEVEI